MTWSPKYPLSIIAGGDTKESGFTKVKNEFTSIYGDLDTHIHDGTVDNGPKVTAANITNVAAGNIAATDVQAALNELDTEKAALAGPTFTGAINEKKGDNIASDATINLTTATGNLVHITGTVTITAVTLGSGMRREVIFDGALTLTHHATNNNLPGGANITTAAGDRATYWGDGTTVYCTKYQKANGKAVIMTGDDSIQFSVADATTAHHAVALGQFLGTFGANGFRTLPDGTIIQWGIDTSGTAGVRSISFPTTFPNVCYIVIPVAASAARIATPSSITTSGYSLTVTDTSGSFNNANAYWFALGK